MSFAATKKLTLIILKAKRKAKNEPFERCRDLKGRDTEDDI